jgi:hypothetical protein
MSLKVELAKLRHAHKLNLVSIIVEKLLLAAVFAFVAFLGNRAVEHYKDSLAERRFFLESRLIGLQKITATYGKLTEYCYLCGRLEGKLTEEQRAGHEQALKDFINETNQYSFLFSKALATKLAYHVWFHDAVVNQSVAITRENYPFAIAVSNNFADMTRAALWEETLGRDGGQDEAVFQFDSWDPDEMGSKTGKDFFEANYQKWLKESAAMANPGQVSK